MIFKIYTKFVEEIQMLNYPFQMNEWIHILSVPTYNINNRHKGINDRKDRCILMRLKTLVMGKSGSEK